MTSHHVKLASLKKEMRVSARRLSQRKPLFRTFSASADQDLTTDVVVSELSSFIVGQDAAKKAVAIALRSRWRRTQLADALNACKAAEEKARELRSQLRTSEAAAAAARASAAQEQAAAAASALELAQKDKENEEKQMERGSEKEKEEDKKPANKHPNKRRSAQRNDSKRRNGGT